MNTTLKLLSCCIILLAAGCSDNNKQTVATGTDKSNYNNVVDKPDSTKPEHPSGYNVSVPGYLEQNWDHETRMEWWYTSQGSHFLPYDWFLALERPDSEQLISAKENLEQFRFVAWPADGKWNPDGLPIGFVADKDEATGLRYMGFTCAACHTGKIAFKGKEVLVEGAPAHHDFDGFAREVTLSLQKTLEDKDKFSRFVRNLGKISKKQEDVNALQVALSEQSKKFSQRAMVDEHPHPYGHARLDAFGEIINEVTVAAVNDLSNKKPADAPVSYPMLWDTPQHDVVQWNGIATNAGIGPYSRNAGEVVGVFGDLRITKTEKDGKTTMSFANHIKLKNLKRLEDILTTLWSPLWPESMLPAIDRTKAAKGQKIYEKDCLSCHHAIKRDDPARKVIASMTPVSDIGTDPMMATNVATRFSKTGILEGQPIFPVEELVPDLPKFAPVFPSVQMVLYGVVGLLDEGLDKATFEQGLPAFLHAVEENTFKHGCDPHKEGLEKCLLPPRYKSRPLNGIWASAPYLHNGSVPNLWELLQKPEQRVASFNVGSWEFDPVNVGFSTAAGAATSPLDTQLPGNSNKGHTYGTELSDDEKWALIEYMKSL